MIDRQTVINDWSCPTCHQAITIPQDTVTEIVNLIGDGRGASSELLPVDTLTAQPGTSNFQVHCQRCQRIYALHVKPKRRDDPAETVRGEVLTVKRLREPFAKKPTK